MSAFSESGGPEVAALRQHEHPAILRLLDADIDRQRMVAEYHPLGNYHIVSQADLAEAAAKIDRARGA